MGKEISSAYFIEFSELESRLDFVFNNPKFDYIEEIKKDFSIEYFGERVNNIISFSKVFTEFKSGTDYKGANYPDNGEYYFRAGDINTDNEIEISADTKFVPTEFANTNIPKINTGDILIVKDGATTGKIGIVPKGINDKPFNTHVFKLSPKSNKYRNRFLYYFLQSNLGVDLFEKYISGSAQGGITKDAIYQIFLIKKTIFEQDSILNILKPLEKKVAKLKKELKKQQDNAENLIYGFLGFDNYTKQKYFFKEAKDDTISFWKDFDQIDKRLDFLHYHPKHNLMDRLKLKYQTVKLKEIVSEKIKRGIQPKYSEIGEKKVLKTTNLKNRFIDFENALLVDEDFFNKNTNSQTKNNDILFASTGLKSMGKIDVFENKTNFIVDGHIAIIRVNENYDPNFITYFLRSDFGKTQIDRLFSGSSGQIEIQPKEIDEIIIPSFKSIPKAKQIEISKKIQKAIDKAIEIETLIIDKKAEILKLFENELFNK